MWPWGIFFFFLLFVPLLTRLLQGPRAQALRSETATKAVPVTYEEQNHVPEVQGKFWTGIRDISGLTAADPGLSCALEGLVPNSRIILETGKWDFCVCRGLGKHRWPVRLWRILKRPDVLPISPVSKEYNSHGTYASHTMKSEKASMRKDQAAVS